MNNILRRASMKAQEMLRGDPCRANYEFGKALGTGSFATVHFARDRKDGTTWAIKCIQKSSLTQEDLDALEIEVEAMKKIDHRHVVKLREVYDTGKIFYMVTELMTGGELFDRVVSKEKYTEAEAQQAVKMLVDGLVHCHSLGIVHRDLKPENLLYETEAEDADLKIADFGLAKIVGEENMMRTACGTPGYVAPEIIKGLKYDKQCDVWSLGVIVYILLCGYPPFYHTNSGALYKLIKSGTYAFQSPYWDHVSEAAKDLIRKMLTVDPAERIEMHKILEHEWFQESSVENMASHDLGDAQKMLRNFNAKAKLKAGMRAAAALARFKKFEEAAATRDSMPAEGMQLARKSSNAKVEPLLGIPQVSN